MTLAARLPPLLVVAVMLHTAVLPQLRIAGVSPDLLLLIGIAAGMVAGPDRGALVGFAAGLLADCFLQTPFGLSALTYSLVAYAVGVLQTRILHAAPWIPVVTAIGASAVGVILFAVLGAVVGQAHLLERRLLDVVLVVALVNGALALLVVPPVRWATTPQRAGAVLR